MEQQLLTATARVFFFFFFNPILYDCFYVDVIYISIPVENFITQK